MKFYSVPDKNLLADVPEEDYKSGHEVGVIRVGKRYLFFRKGLTHFAVPYTDITKIFRRVHAIPAQLCCGKGDIEIQSLVVCTEAGEAAVIKLPDQRAAKALWEELKEAHPEIDFTAPKRDETAETAGNKEAAGSGEKDYRNKK